MKSEAAKKHLNDIFKRKTPRFDPRRAGYPDLFLEEHLTREEIIRCLSPQRMDGEPIFISGGPAVREEVEADGSLVEAMEEARNSSPYGKSERVDWWVRAGCPWPDDERTMKAAGDSR